MDKIYRGRALNPGFQSVYEQALSELSQYGRETDRYYCRRLNRYVSIQEINRVAALENVMQVLEDAHNVAHALALLSANVYKWIDLDTHNRYVELVEDCEEQASSMGAFPEDSRFYYPRG